MRLACNLRHARGTRTIAQMADLTRIGAGDLSRIETGRLLPADHQIRAIENAYGITRLEAWNEAALLAILPDEVAA